MNKKNFSLMIFVLLLTSIILFNSCTENGVSSGSEQKKIEKLESPYLICVGRNPGGVGFDFLYNGSAGGACYMDDPGVDDFAWDIKIITNKAEKPDGNQQGMPRIQLAEGVQAANYSNIQTSCKGFDEYENLENVDVSSIPWKSDDADFKLKGLSAGENTGLPVMSELQMQYQKLVIGDKWKVPLKNSVDSDEPVWLIKTENGDLVKLIVTEFPADPANYPDHEPEVTATGFIALSWEIVE